MELNDQETTGRNVWDVESHEAPVSHVTDYTATFGKRPWRIHQITMKETIPMHARAGRTLFEVYRVDKETGTKIYGKIYGPRWTGPEDEEFFRYRYYWNDLLELPLYVRKKLAELNEDGPWFELDHNWYHEIDRAVGNILTMQWLPSRVRNDR